MKNLSQQLKQALSALATADAGEMLTRRQMARALHGNGTPARRRQVALWAGSTVSKAALDYGLSTCKRLDADLLVLHIQGADTAHLRKRLGNEPFQLVALSGRPDAALRHYLATHSQVAFLVLDGNDHANQSLSHRAGTLGVPMVLVTGDHREPSSPLPHPAAPAAAMG